MSNKRSRNNINYDDDDQVERLLLQVQRKKEKKDEAEELVRNASKDEPTLIAEITADLGQIVSNIESGDCPYRQLTNAFVIAQEPHELGGKNAVCVLLNFDGPLLTTEAQLFESLCGSGEISNGLEDLEPGYKTPLAAMPHLVRTAIKDGRVAASEAVRLTTLFQIWSRDVPWEKCIISSINRPSLPSWQGYPWQVLNFQDRSISCNIRGKNVCFKVAEDTPQMLNLPPAIYQCIWTKKSGRLPNIRDALTKCIEGYKAYEKQTNPDSTKVEKPKKVVFGKERNITNNGNDNKLNVLIRSHICSICGHGFIQKQSLQRHGREIHKIPPMPS